MISIAHFFAPSRQASPHAVTRTVYHHPDRDLKIVTDHHTNMITIEGWSIAMYLETRYEVVIQFIHDHLSSSDELTIHLKYELFNPTTVKYIFSFIKLLNVYHAAGKKVNIQWDCNEDMDDMLDTGFDLSVLCNFEFKIVLL